MQAGRGRDRKAAAGDRIGGRCKLVESCRLKEAGACKQAYMWAEKQTCG
jgi:hypothetical protein